MTEETEEVRREREEGVVLERGTPTVGIEVVYQEASNTLRSLVTVSQASVGLTATAYVVVIAAALQQDEFVLALLATALPIAALTVRRLTFGYGKPILALAQRLEPEGVGLWAVIDPFKSPTGKDEGRRFRTLLSHPLRIVVWAWLAAHVALLGWLLVQSDGLEEAPPVQVEIIE